MKLNKSNLLKRFRALDIQSIQDESLREQARTLNAKQGGFTLLELLIVVAILAAIAGTATLALQDTDARASAAAHVAMMDELNKGIHTYRVINRNAFPDNFDALLGADVTTDGNAAVAAYPANDLVAIEDVGTLALTTDAVGILNDIGMTSLQYLDYGNGADLDGNGTTTDCESANVVGTIESRANAVVANNIFMTPAANGCGTAVSIAAGDQVLVWTGGYERIMGSAGVQFDTLGVPTIASPGAAVTAGAAGTPVIIAVGTGPSSTLFNSNELGGMTTVPVYRHVGPLQYGRYVALFNIGTFTGTGAAYDAADQVTFLGVVDGAGDTKEEELGEWDGTRNTI
jgi:prepilin-type N-terminal cleavage/methylation domain-containing protein